MEARLMKNCWNGSGIDDKNIAEWKAGFSIKIYNVCFAPNCPGQTVAPNCPRRIVRAELSCAELSGNPLNTVRN